MMQSAKISLLFIGIFILGVLGVISIVNNSLDKGDQMKAQNSRQAVVTVIQPVFPQKK